MRTIFKEAIVCAVAAIIMLNIADHTGIPELFQIVPLWGAKSIGWPPLHARPHPTLLRADTAAAQ